MSPFNFHHHNPNIINGIYNLNIQDEYSAGLFSSGLNPLEIDENWEQNLNLIKQKSLDENCFAIGECGLDARIDTENQLQQKIFLQQIDWANDIQKPVIIHCVRRFNEILELKKFAKTAWVIHGFNKNKTIAEKLIESGFYLSFGKPLLHNLSLQEIFNEIPLSRIFLETDDADFEIESLYEKASNLRNISLENIRNQIFENLREIKK